MTKHVVRLPIGGRPFLDIFSGGRAGPRVPGGFTRGQIEQIWRTVRRTPEVMVKVTGGGNRIGAFAAHLSYISRQGRLDIETDEGERVSKEGQRALVKDWHLELSAGQYRPPRGPKAPARSVKLVHNIVLSMPAPTPPDKVLAAAKVFTREKFALKHRYAMVLRTHQQHPHVHLVVKAENEHGRRLHIDKALLREWREDFARMMREQGVPANATPRGVRGRNKGTTKDGIYRAQRQGRSRAVRDRVTKVAKELGQTVSIRDPMRNKLLETRKCVLANWMKTADVLESQGEVVLAGEVRYFAHHLPPVLTDQERLGAGLIRHLEALRTQVRDLSPDTKGREQDLTR